MNGLQRIFVFTVDLPSHPGVEDCLNPMGQDVESKGSQCFATYFLHFSTERRPLMLLGSALFFYMERETWGCYTLWVIVDHMVTWVFSLLCLPTFLAVTSDIILDYLLCYAGLESLLNISPARSTYYLQFYIPLFSLLSLSIPCSRILQLHIQFYLNLIIILYF